MISSAFKSDVPFVCSVVSPIYRLSASLKGSKGKLYGLIIVNLINDAIASPSLC